MSVLEREADIIFLKTICSGYECSTGMTGSIYLSYMTISKQFVSGVVV